MKFEKYIAALLLFFCLSSCTPTAASTPPTVTFTAVSTFTLIPSTATNTNTAVPTLVESTPTNSSCQLPIRGTYNYSNTDTVFNLIPGRYLFYDLPGGGQYGNDQAACELNYDCTQLRAINKDTADPNPEGVIGAWVDAQTETSKAEWHEYIVECSLGNTQ